MTKLLAANRTFLIGYTSLKESPLVPGTHIAEVELVEVGRGVVGGVILVLEPQARDARIDWAFVADRRKGIGRAIVQAVEKDLVSRGYRQITLNAVPDSIPFWKRLGYEVEEEEVPGEGLEMGKGLSSAWEKSIRLIQPAELPTGHNREFFGQRIMNITGEI